MRHSLQRWSVTGLLALVAAALCGCEELNLLHDTAPVDVSGTWTASMERTVFSGESGAGQTTTFTLTLAPDLFSWAGGAARLRLTTPQIQVFDRAGGLMMDSRIDLPVEAVSETERDRALSELRRRLATSGGISELEQQYVIVMEERWRVKCRFGPLRFDPSGRLAALLEQNPDEFGSGNATLHFLSQDGVYLAKAVFPAAWRDFTLDNGVV